MKNAIVGLLLACFACSAESEQKSVEELQESWTDMLEPEAVVEVEPQPESELGRIEQALTVTSGYGVLIPSQGRCNGQTNGCIIPKSKTIKFHNRTGSGHSTCNGFYAQMIRDQAAAAINNVKTILENRGWTVTVDTLNATAVSSQNFTDVTLRCDTSTPNGTAINIAGTSPNCISTTGDPLSYCRLYGATIRMDPSDITTIAAQTTDSVKQGKMVLNVWTHEIGHTIVFGHGPTCTGVQVMCNAADMNLSDPNTWGNRSYTNDEKSWLQSFVP
jgi:hypothetical protein